MRGVSQTAQAASEVYHLDEIAERNKQEPCSADLVKVMSIDYCMIYLLIMLGK